MQKALATFWHAIPKWLKIAGTALLVLFIVSFFAVGWLVSSRVLAVNPQKIVYDQTVIGIDGDKYTIRGGAYNITGVVGGIRPDGSMIGIFSAPANSNAAAETSTRTLAAVPSPVLHIGDKLSLQGNVWTSDPMAALGLAFENVTYTSELGDMKAWLIPRADSTKWTIGVHGVGADKTEMLRFIKPVHDAGDNVLVINYRNDVGNPASPDNHTHLGDTEWRDVEAAVACAKAHGATDIRLYGNSLGGSVVENYLRRTTTDRAIISRVILDSPALDWNEVLQRQLQKGGYPKFIYYPGSVVLKLRAGISIKNISTQAEDINKRTLIIHSADDPTVPQAASKALASARPDLVTLADFKRGGHVRSWNHDQLRYEKLITDFLSQ